MNFLWWYIIIYGVILISCENLKESSIPLSVVSESSTLSSDLNIDINNRLARRTPRLLPGETMGGLQGCDSFKIGNEHEKEFYSPDYPMNYTNGTTCVKIISADSKNQQIVLDFRDSFNLEPSDNCKFDSLEVRDGQFGYSPSLGKYCGHEFPPLITSSGPYLWLKFYSDENIEYSGFRAVYEFVERQAVEAGVIDDEPCSINITGKETEYITEENITQNVWDRGHKIGVDCMYTIIVDEDKQVSLQWDFFTLDYPNDCEKNYVDVFGEKTDNRLSCFCGAAAETVISKDRIMQVHLVLDKSAITAKFRAHFTAYRVAPQNCTEEEFNCQDGTCIAAHLKCNHIVNCRTGSDEDEEDCKVELTLWEHLIASDILIILIVFFVIMFGMCFTLIFNIVRKLIHDYNVIKEHVTQSRESQLDQIGKKTPAATILTPVLTVLPNFSDSIMNNSAGVRNSIILSESDDCHVPTDHVMFPHIIRRDSSYERLNQNGDVHYHIRHVQADINHNRGVYTGEVEEDGLIIHQQQQSNNNLCCMPQMRDTECQTRESLFHNVPSSYNSSINNNNRRSSVKGSTSKSPSPPVDPSKRIRQNPTPMGIGGNFPIGFTTFGYNNFQKPDNSSSSSRQDPSIRDHNTFRAEAIIEVDKHKMTPDRTDSNRPYSVQSTKSAPDVIVTH